MSSSSAFSSLEPAFSPAKRIWVLPDTLLETFASQSSLALTNAQLYRRLEQQSQELAVASRHKSEFLASMSHELRTPLNAIIGFSEVLIERMFGEVNERQAQYLGHIHESGRHLLALLNDILDLSKIEAGQMVLEPGPVDVATLVESTAGLVRERAVRMVPGEMQLTWTPCGRSCAAKQRV